MIRLLLFIIPLINSLQYQNITTHYLKPTDFLRQSIEIDDNKQYLLLSSDSISVYDASTTNIKQSIMKSQLSGLENEQLVSIIKYDQSIIVMSQHNYVVYSLQQLHSLDLQSIVRKYPNPHDESTIQAIRQQDDNIYIGYKDGTIQQYSLQKQESHNQTLSMVLQNTIKPVQSLLDLQIHNSLLFVSQPTSTQLLIVDTLNKYESISKTKYGKQGMIQRIEVINDNIAIIGMGNGMVYVIDHVQSTILGLLSGANKDVSEIKWTYQSKILKVVVGYYNGCWNYYQFNLIDLMDSGKYFKEIKSEFGDCSMSGAVKHVAILDGNQILLGAKRGIIRLVQIEKQQEQQKVEEQDIKQDL